MSSPRNASRRDALKTVGLAASGAAAGLVLTHSPRVDTTMKPGDPPGVDPGALKDREIAAAAAKHRYLDELVGVELGDYRVEWVGSLERGGIPVQLAHAGKSFRVDILRADPTDLRAGIGPVTAVSVYLRNGGSGNTPTDERMGLGAMALAAELARREQAGWKPPAALMTMAERSALDAVSVA